jgi:hypothetical protein
MELQNESLRLQRTLQDEEGSGSPLNKRQLKDWTLKGFLCGTGRDRNPCSLVDLAADAPSQIAGCCI